MKFFLLLVMYCTYIIIFLKYCSVSVDAHHNINVKGKKYDHIMQVYILKLSVIK